MWKEDMHMQHLSNDLISKWTAPSTLNKRYPYRAGPNLTIFCNNNRSDMKKLWSSILFFFIRIDPWHPDRVSHSNTASYNWNYNKNNVQSKINLPNSLINSSWKCTWFKHMGKDPVLRSESRLIRHQIYTRCSRESISCIKI